MAVKRKRISSSGKKFFNHKRILAFVISTVLIGFMLWQILLTIGNSSNATFGRRICKPGDAKKAWGGFSLCHTGRADSCANECTCIPFKGAFKFGRCLLKREVTPTPTVTPQVPTRSPPGNLTCGDDCITDDQCASGYCHDPNWQACPTETPEPTCMPRPPCLDATPRCLPPEPVGGWCPAKNTPTPTRKPPKPTKMCGVRSLVPLQKQCRDRECFAGEQCACPVPSITPHVPTPTNGVVCTADAKLCPDGSYVSRTGPNCEFAPCPGT